MVRLIISSVHVIYSGDRLGNVNAMTEGRSLDELPDAVFVPLGRRGMEGVTLKECTYACDGKEISLKGVKTDPPEITGKSVEVVIEDWTVECDKCHREFVIRCRIRYIDGARIDTMVSLLDDKGHNLGWLGNY